LNKEQKIMKTILVPTDFSANADNALNFAIELSKKMKSKIILLNVFDIKYASGYVSFDSTAAEIKEARNESEKKLKVLATRVKAEGVSCQTRSEYELIVDSILEVSDKEKVDLIVIGTKGASNLPQGIIGTNTAAVIEKAECPVFAVPENCHFHKLQNIVMATDYHEGDFTLLKKIIDLFKPFKAHISLLHVSDNSEQYSKDMMEVFAQKASEKSGLNSISHTVLPPGNVEDQLEMYILQRSIDLLVVSPQHHNFFSRLFGTSLSRKLAYHTHTPLLAVHSE